MFGNHRSHIHVVIAGNYKFNCVHIRSYASMLLPLLDVSGTNIIWSHMKANQISIMYLLNTINCHMCLFFSANYRQYQKYDLWT